MRYSVQYTYEVEHADWCMSGTASEWKAYKTFIGAFINFLRFKRKYDNVKMSIEFK